MSLLIPILLTSACRKSSAEVVTAAELVRVYELDAAAADRSYEGKTLTVSGRMEARLPQGPPAIGPLKDLSGQPMIFLENQKLACTFAAGQYESAARVQIGQEI